VATTLRILSNRFDRYAEQVKNLPRLKLREESEPS
jgi:hypothetical protein